MNGLTTATDLPRRSLRSQRTCLPAGRRQRHRRRSKQQRHNNKNNSRELRDRSLPPGGVEFVFVVISLMLLSFFAFLLFFVFFVTFVIFVVSSLSLSFVRYSIFAVLALCRELGYHALPCGVSGFIPGNLISLKWSRKCQNYGLR